MNNLKRNAVFSFQMNVQRLLVAVFKVSNKIVNGVTAANRWHRNIIGLEEVTQLQNRVLNIQEKLFRAQEQRRTVGLELAQLRRRLNQLHADLQSVNRQTDFERFFELIKTETELRRDEQHAAERLQNTDSEERDLFTAFTNAIRDSHEKQRAQLEYTKYLGLVLSITGSLITFAFAQIKKHDLKAFVEQQLVRLERENGIRVQQLAHQMGTDVRQELHHLESHLATEEQLFGLQEMLSRRPQEIDNKPVAKDGVNSIAIGLAALCLGCVLSKMF